MLLDALFAWAHFVFLFMLISVLGGQAMLLRLPMTPDAVRLLGKVDRGYGLSAIGLLIAGLLRVHLGAKGSDYYLHEHYFWAKIGVFVIMGLISMAPTITFIRWRKALNANPAFTPDAAQVKRTQLLVRTQLGLLGVTALFAVLMARGFGAT